ncbi:S8 family serine peptidase [Sporosarcina sp. BP05]|uniref:S8 family serine peptidase n=1 Tax=Sporosarcina sp. BP05 TaxID=2758726 RepID=UPI001645DB7C|nr:S8 family serine peptidase [Sporosarcina sp. BP05]
MVKLKRTLLLTLVFMLSLSSAAFGMTGSTSGGKSNLTLPTLELQKPDRKVPEKLVNPADPNEKVRIIVELEKAPAIETATKRGLLYKDLPSAQRDSLESAVESDQVDVQASVTKVAPSIKYIENFTTVFNGFSAEVDAKFVEGIANTKGVKSVYESTEYQRPDAKPEMIHSKELVQAQRAWNDYGVRGEGMVVGVIDTGIDPSHRDMILTDDKTGSITKEKLDTLKADGSIENGKYFTAKVPFGYNYMDGNEEILDLGPDASMHGMHVGGTVAANGDEENGGIMGVAPEAQLLALKVFGNDPLYPSTFGDIYIKAIDDAIKLGVDVINMSLGSTAAYVNADDPEQQAVKRATENGVLVAISAGNSNMYGSGTFYPYTENQDYGLTGSPSVANESLGVASYENSKVTAYGFSYQFDDVKTGEALYLLANDADPTKQEQTKFEIMDAGLGNPQDFTGKDFKGKFALVSRGVIGFVDKGLNAQAAGAAGVIIYNNAAGTINMASDPAIKIPYMSTLQGDGNALKAGLDSGKSVTVDFDGSFVVTANANAGKMSDFSSWGPTPNLDFKPEITAPGGNIFSTFNNNEYGLMSGTSMAAPHVAGGTALILERVDKEFGLTGSKRYQLAKNLLMNTAKPVELNPGEYVSPRRQGSGLMQLANALNTDVVVTNKATGEAKVALKEIKDNKLTLTLEAKNFSDKEKTFNVDTQVQMDTPVNSGGVFVNLPNDPKYGQFVLDDEDIEVQAPKTVTIPANGTAEISVTVDVSFMAEIFATIYPNGFYVDGFVTLTDADEEITGNVPLTVPFFGFNGQWDDGSIFDYFAWDPMTYWGYTALADEQGNFIQGGGTGDNFDTTRFAFSPNGDGIRDKAIPVYSLFRNAKQFKVKVLDSEGNELRTIRTASDLRKHYIESATANPYTYNTNYGWDGKVNGKIAVDGNYFIELSAVIDFEGAKWQSIKFPVKVDTVAPTAKVEFDTLTGTISVADFKDNENGAGADRWEVLLNGNVVANQPVTSKAFVLKNVLTNKDVVTVKAWDSANNFAEYKFSKESVKETKEPVIFLKSPGMTDAYDTNKIVVSGTVEDDSKIATLTVNGEKAEKFDGVNFSHTLTFEDGVHDVKVEAVDEHGNKMQIRRIFFVDTQAPVVSVKNYPTKTNDSKVTVKVTVKDNFDDIALYVNGNEFFRNVLSEPYAMKGFEKDVDVALTLVDGKNEFTFEAEDLAGHKITQTITIEKTDVVVENPGNGGGLPTTPVDPKPVDPKPVDPKPVTPPVFSDITNIFAKDEINKLAAKGIIQGKTETNFAPNAQITRAEFTVLLARALDLPLKEYAGTFSDVNTSKKWAYAAVEAAAHAGIVNGTTGGKFNPDAPIKREEIAAMVIRAIEYQDKTKLTNLDTPANFKDHGSIGAFAIDSVYKANALGVILGNNGQFNPKNNATRAEAAVMLYRALDKLELLK